MKKHLVFGAMLLAAGAANAGGDAKLTVRFDKDGKSQVCSLTGKDADDAQRTISEANISNFNFVDAKATTIWEDTKDFASGSWTKTGLFSTMILGIVASNYARIKALFSKQEAEETVA